MTYAPVGRLALREMLAFPSFPFFCSGPIGTGGIMSLTESQTRATLINPQLEAAEWKLGDRTQVRFEVPVAGYDSAPSPGITD